MVVATGGELPRPPFLFVRPLIAFWATQAPIEGALATPDALTDGCFLDAVVYDASGGRWPVIAARSHAPIRVFDRLFASRRVQAALELGSRGVVSLDDVSTQIDRILVSAHDFLEFFPHDPAESRRRVRACRSLEELIQLVLLISPG